MTDRLFQQTFWSVDVLVCCEWTSLKSKIWWLDSPLTVKLQHLREWCCPLLLCLGYAARLACLFFGLFFFSAYVGQWSCSACTALYLCGSMFFLQVPKVTHTEFCQGRTMRWALAWSFYDDVSVPVSFMYSLHDHEEAFHRNSYQDHSITQTKTTVPPS